MTNEYAYEMFKSEDKEIALMDGDVQIGTALIRDYKDGEIFLTDFEIFPRFRDKGFGKSQLNKLINDYGVNALTVAADNSCAKHIYDKAGFKVVGEPYYDDNAKETVYYMKNDILLKRLREGRGLSPIGYGDTVLHDFCVGDYVDTPDGRGRVYAINKDAYEPFVVVFTDVCCPFTNATKKSFGAYKACDIQLLTNCN